MATGWGQEPVVVCPLRRLYFRNKVSPFLCMILDVLPIVRQVGTFTLAYAAHKALSPIRFPPTVALTPVVAKYLGKKDAVGSDK